ncbi:MAG: NAD(P)-dependent oxidoreductase [Candidatus Zixiibacteriota bacterium]
MHSNLPGIVVTGASGFIGRHFVDAVKGKFRLFCLARRSQKESEIPSHENIRWTQVDIAHFDSLREPVRCILEHGGADFVLHLAGYYDFTNEDNEEYQRTNVQGTRNILKLAKQIGTRRFLFASSLAACKFPARGKTIDESSPPVAQYPYAISKRAGEELIKEHQEWFPSAIVRMAAIYSDWCEYPPLYVFINTWTASKWNSRVLGGRGHSAVPYLHVQDLIRFFLKVIEKTDSLPRLCTLNASPNGFTTHIELYKTATRYFFGRDVRPLLMPKFLVYPGMASRQAIGRITGDLPFERLWMASYIDKILNVDASATHSKLHWTPTPRYDILRRLLFLVENMKNHADAWHIRNEAALRRVAQRPNFVIYNHLVENREAIIDEIFRHIWQASPSSRFPRYRKLGEKALHWYIALIYQILCAVVRTRDRTLMRHYAETIARRRFVEGFDVGEVSDFLLTIGDVVSGILRSCPDLKGIEQRIYDFITMTFQLAADEIQDSYEFLSSEFAGAMDKAEEALIPANVGDLERIVFQIEDICQDMREDHLRDEIGKLRT